MKKKTMLTAGQIAKAQAEDKLPPGLDPKLVMTALLMAEKGHGNTPMVEIQAEQGKEREYGK